MKLIFFNRAFRALNVRSSHIDLLKKANFIHNKTDGWFTTNPASAVLLRDFADESTKDLLTRFFIHHSRWKNALVYPRGEKPLAHQVPSALYALSRNKSYLALDPGLGKTPIAAMIAGAMLGGCIYICPPFLALNTQDEFERWVPQLTTAILGTKNDWFIPDVLIVPDSIIKDKHVQEYLKAVSPRLLIGDEVHRMKTRSAGRTKGFLGWKHGKKTYPGLVDLPSLEKIVVMSGTPMPNRPLEIYPLLSKLAGQYINFCTADEFGMKYCAGQWNGYGYDYSGANKKTLRELASRMMTSDPYHVGSFMLRLRKDILGLNKPITETVVLGSEVPVVLKGMESSLLKKYSPEDLVKHEIAFHNQKSVLDFHISTYKRLLGVHKIDPAIEFIKSVLEETDDNLLIFGVHKEVIQILNDKLKKYDPLFITDKTTKTERHNMVKEFQTNKNKRIFGGNIQKIGIGLTLTKANRIIFLEWLWVPGENSQAVDRVYRYGMKGTLLVQYLLFKNSLDRKILDVVNRKAAVTAIV